MKRFIIILVCAVLLVSLLYFSLHEQKNQKNEVVITTVKRLNFDIVLNIVGILDAAQAHMVSSEIRGTDRKIISLVEDGTRVKKGDVLVRLDPAPFEKEIDQLSAEVEGHQAAVQAGKEMVAFEKNQVTGEITNAEYNVNVANLEVIRLKDGDGPLKLSQLQDEFQKAKLELDRYQSFYNDLLELRKNGYDNSSEIVSAKEKVTLYEDQFKAATTRFESYKLHVLPTLLETAKAKQQNAGLVLQQTTQGGKYRIAKAEAGLIQIQSQLKAKEAALQQVRSELEKTVIHAPFDGIVIHFETFRDGEKRKPRIGDSVLINQPILYLPDITNMIVKSKVREIDLHTITLEQQGVIQVDAYPDRSFTGRLTFIGAVAVAEASGAGKEKYFQVVFDLTEEDERLRPGMTCRLSIVSRSVTQVIAVPVQAVFSGDQKAFCYVMKKHGGFETRQVTVGSQNTDVVEITEGLREGEKISMTRPADYQ
jgi:HlyD family secretion protein